MMGDVIILIGNCTQHTLIVYPLANLLVFCHPRSTVDASLHFTSGPKITTFVADNEKTVCLLRGSYNE